MYYKNGQPLTSQKWENMKNKKDKTLMNLIRDFLKARYSKIEFKNTAYRINVDQAVSDEELMNILYTAYTDREGKYAFEGQRKVNNRITHMENELAKKIDSSRYSKHGNKKRRK